MPTTETARVRAEEIAYRYPQNTHGLEATSLSACPGEMVLVGGPSGSGKSTLARCLTGLIPHLYRGALSGTVWLEDVPTTATPLWQLAERAGMVFQNPAAQMLTSTVEEEIVFGLENLGLPSAAIHTRLEQTLAQFGLEPFRRRTPQTLSGGEQQKLALAAIIARRPPVLALDEPFSMLDSTAAAELVGYLTDEVRAGTTVVICEHREEYLGGLPNLRTVRLASRAGIPPHDGAAALLPNSHTPVCQMSVRDVSVQLGGRTVLRDLSFSVRGGEVVAVVGRNGVGKTTLLRALAGLQPHQGAIEVDGAPPDLGLVFQNADLQLFNASVREEILYRVGTPDMALYAHLLEALGLTRYEDVPPLLLSEGEKKRVALATVLMRRPRHGILLDEPALGQDAAHKEMLVRIARGLAATGQLVILTTHDLTLAAYADRLLLMGAEGIVADGPPARVMRDPMPWAHIGLCIPDWVALPPLDGGAP
ncbi:MAG: ABC transporter ATP-binding protein [Anaerolineae bacterium]|nr:ABC transporter ATP-binding protein [Anaerolineae bacterium]